METSINIVKLKEYASTCSVLYVEDDETIRTQTALFLGRFFPDVVLAEDGAIGLSKYKERNFDIVITDINMPNMNGIEMIEGIKEIHYEQIVLVTSAYNDSEYLMRLINLNVMRFIPKPFNNKQFLYVIYKIAEELTLAAEQVKLQSENVSLSKRSQSIVDHLKVGIIVIKENKIDMANKAFLEIGGFYTFDMLVLEMPEIGVLFEESVGCISATSNEELIEQLKTLKEEERKVRIIKDMKTLEYQVNLSELEDENSYILSFNDITAIHNALNRDKHTNLPTKIFTLEKIELLKQKVSELNVILVSVKHFENIEKWYGKQDAIEVEVAFSNMIKSIRNSISPTGFIGYFERNKIIVVPAENTQECYNELKNINLTKLSTLKKNPDSGVELELTSKVRMVSLDTNKEMNNLEVDLINEFDAM